MPTYEYQCPSCGYHFEKFQSFSDEPIKECPTCGQPVKKVFSPAGIIFKGSGWYINDSKKTSTSTVPAKDKDGEVKTEAPAAETKTEAPAAKADGASEAKPAAEAPKAKTEAA